MTRDLERPWWIGAVIALLGGVWLYGGSRMAQTSAIAGVGPGLFVTLIGIGLLVAGVALLVQAVASDPAQAAEPEDGALVTPFRPSSFMLALGSAVLPMLLMRPLGFPITAALVFAGVARAFGSTRIVFDLALGAAVSVTSWLIFNQLGVNLGSFLPFLDR